MIVASAGRPPRLVMVPRDDGGAEYARILLASAARTPARAEPTPSPVERIERVRADRDARRRRLVRRPKPVTAAAAPISTPDCFRCADYGERGWGRCPHHSR